MAESECCDMRFMGVELFNEVEIFSGVVKENFSFIVSSNKYLRVGSVREACNLVIVIRDHRSIVKVCFVKYSVIEFAKFEYRLFKLDLGEVSFIKVGRIKDSIGEVCKGYFNLRKVVV